jgi:tight adherence protein C
MAARLRNHSQRRTQLRAEMLSGKPSGASKRREEAVGALKRLLDKLQLLRGGEARKTSDQLAQAGWRSRDSLVIYLGLRLGLPIVIGCATFFAIWVVAPETPGTQMLLGAMVGVVLGFFVPTLGLKRAISRRQNLLRKQLPDGLDLLVICTEAGLSLDAAVNRVAREMGFSAPQLADELGLTAVELGFLPNRRQALMNLAKRAPLPSIRGVVNTLVQTERYGTPLAHALRVLSLEFREERMLKAEEKAAKLPATMTVPMILFILPVLFIVMITPAVVQIMGITK